MMFKSIAVLFVVVVAVAFAITAGAQVVTDGLVSYWSFEDGDVSDQVGTNDGTVVGDPETVAGHVGANAMKFDGDDAITFPMDGFPTGNEPRTFSAWFKREVSDGGASQYIAAYGTWDGKGNGFGVATRGGDQIFIAQWGLDTVGPTVSLGEWHYVAAVYDGTADIIYLDGAEVTNNVLGEPINTQMGNGAIGANPDPNEFMEGLIDDVGLYNRALSAEEATQNYEARAGLESMTSVETAGKLTSTWAKMKSGK